MQPNHHVLLVEDEAPKRGHIEKLLKDIAPSARVSSARSVNSALDIIEVDPVDLLLLDMSLPTYDMGERERGGRPQGFGGIEVLRNMVMADIVCPTVVITGYEGFTREGGGIVDLAQLRSELEAEFPDYVRAVLHYNSTYDDWKVALAKWISEVNNGAGTK